MTSKTPQPPDELYGRLKRLGLYGLIARWPELHGEPWLDKLAQIEESERKRRSLERRIHNAQIGTFKPLADFDWGWPERVDRELVEELFSFQFIRDAANAILVGPNGTGKTMIGQNLAHQTLLAGHTVRFTSASAMLNDLAAQDSSRALQQRLKRYVNPTLLVVDEVGYLSYGNRHADLLFEVVTRRYEKNKSIVLTTNKPFAEWPSVFPNAACVVTLVDRLIHRAELVVIEAESYRLREAQERQQRRSKPRRPPKDDPPTSPTP